MLQVEETKSIIESIIDYIKNIRNLFYQYITKFTRWQRVIKVDYLYYSCCTKNEKSILNKTQKNIIDNLYDKYIKIRYNSHIFYTAKTGVFSENYIPDSLWRNYIDPFYNDWSQANVIDNKCLYPLLFSEVKQPSIICYRINGFWYNKEGKIIDLSVAMAMVMAEKECFIKKAVNSWGGKGVLYFLPSSSNSEELIKIVNEITVDIVIQEAIKQSPILARLNGDCVNTVRLLSFLRSDGSVKIYSSVLRMGIAGAKVDNASSGGISCGIKDSGQLRDKAYTNTGIVFNEHPSTKVKFGEIYVPNFNKMKDIVVRIHPKFPYFRMIGWDMACDYNNEPILIEANLCDSELDFHQLNNGPIFANDIEIILSEVFNTK